VSEQNEVPWFSEPPEAKLARKGCKEGDVIYGWLHFIDPQGNRAAVPVTLGEQTTMEFDGGPGSPIWHIDIDGDVATVSPSIHYVGAWHSPNPVQFKLVKEIG
jgi:hypothetical protein